MPFPARTDVRLPVSLCGSGIFPQSIRRMSAAGQRQAAPCGAPHIRKRNRRLRMLRIKAVFPADAAPFPAAARHAATYVPPPAALSGAVQIIRLQYPRSFQQASCAPVSSVQPPSERSVDSPFAMPGIASDRLPGSGISAAPAVLPASPQSIPPASIRKAPRTGLFRLMIGPYR